MFDDLRGRDGQCSHAVTIIVDPEIQRIGLAILRIQLITIRVPLVAKQAGHAVAFHYEGTFAIGAERPGLGPGAPPELTTIGSLHRRMSDDVRPNTAVTGSASSL